MQVSAISVNHNKGYKFSNNKPFYNNQTSETNNDTAFNSLTPYASRKTVSAEKMSQVFDNINEWQNFCHKQILGANLNTLA